MEIQHPSPRRGRSPPPQFSAHFYCGQTAGCIKMPLGKLVWCWSQPRRLCVRLRPSPPKKGTEPPSSLRQIFGPCLLWPNGCMHQDATWYGGRPRLTRYCVRCGPSYPQKKGHTHPTQFLAHVYCGQMAGWMKTTLVMEVDLGPGHIVLDGFPAPAKGAKQPGPPIFGPCLLWPRSPISATAELLS